MKEIIEENALNVNDLLKEINTDYTTMCNMYFDTMSELKFHTIKEICVACMCVSFYIAKKYDFALLESLFLELKKIIPNNPIIIPIISTIADIANSLGL